MNDDGGVANRKSAAMNKKRPKDQQVDYRRRKETEGRACIGLKKENKEAGASGRLTVTASSHDVRLIHQAQMTKAKQGTTLSSV